MTPIRVKVLEYVEARHELKCLAVESGGEITVDPFVGCAVECDDTNYRDVGRSLVGKEFEMRDYFMASASPCYLMNEGGFVPLQPVPSTASTEHK